MISNFHLGYSIRYYRYSIFQNKNIEYFKTLITNFVKNLLHQINLLS